MPRGTPRPVKERLAELDRRMEQIAEKKKQIRAADVRKQKQKEELRIRVVGLATLRAAGPWTAPKFRTWIEPYLIAPEERMALGFDPLPDEEMERRLERLRAKEAKRQERAEAATVSDTGDPGAHANT